MRWQKWPSICFQNKWEEEKTFPDDLDSKTADHSHQQGKEVGGRQRRCIRSNSSFLLLIVWNNDLKYYLRLVARLKFKETQALDVFQIRFKLWALLKSLTYKHNYYSKQIKERFCCKTFLKYTLSSCHGCHCIGNFKLILWLSSVYTMQVSDIAPKLQNTQLFWADLANEKARLKSLVLSNCKGIQCILLYL